MVWFGVKYKIQAGILLGITVGLFASCRFEYPELKRLEKEVDSAPERALRVLDSCREKHIPMDRHIAWYLHAKARFNLEKLRPRDTLLKRMIPYFEQRKKKKEVAYLSLFVGEAYKKVKRFPEASMYYTEAREGAERVRDSLLLLQIFYAEGDLYVQNNEKAKALVAFREAWQLYEKLPAAVSGAVADNLYEHLGNCLLSLKKYDVAVKFYQQAENYFRRYSDSLDLNDFRYRIGSSYYGCGDYDTAKDYFFKALAAEERKDRAVKYLLALATVCRKYPEADSVDVYLSRAEAILNAEKPDWRLYEQYYWMRAEAEEEQGNYREALAYFRAYDAVTDSTYEEKTETKIGIWVERYKRQHLYAQYMRMKAQRWFLISSVFLLFSFVTVVFLRVRWILRKRKRQQIEAADIMEKMDALLRRHQNKLQELLSHNLGITRRVAMIKAQPLDKNEQFLKRFNEVMYGEADAKTIDWDEIYFTINVLYDGFKDRLVAYCPELTDKEVHLCCLLRAGFNTNEIAFMVEQSVFSIQKRKTAIRKKLHMEEGEDIIKFLLERI